MLREISIFLVVAGVFGCGKQVKKDQSQVSPAANVFTPSDLLTPQFASLDSASLKDALAEEDALFEYRDQKSDSDNNLEESATAAVCLKNFYSKHPIAASGGNLKLGYPIDAEMLGCYYNGFKEAIEKQATKSGTPIESNQYDAKADCANSNSDSAGFYSIPGGATYGEINSDQDLSSYNGKTVLDVPQSYDEFLPITAKGSVVAQQKSVLQGEVCAKKVYGTYTAQEIYDSKCQAEKANDIVTSNCSNTTIKKLANESMSASDFEVFRKGIKGDHYIQEQSVGVARKLGQTFPFAGKKMVTYRNWQGTITFSNGQPSYVFSDGTNTVTGTFDRK